MADLDGRGGRSAPGRARHGLGLRSDLSLLPTSKSAARTADAQSWPIFGRFWSRINQLPAVLAEEPPAPGRPPPSQPLPAAPPLPPGMWPRIWGPLDIVATTDRTATRGGPTTKDEATDPNAAKPIHPDVVRKSALIGASIGPDPTFRDSRLGGVDHTFRDHTGGADHSVAWPRAYPGAKREW